MKALSITDFKTHALKVLSQVAKTKEPVMVTKRGKPLVEVVPFSTPDPIPGKLSEALVFENDIVSPLDEEMWDACK
ncbi:MAG: type II toxin-antitoxin system Phd/YefM family antitoxin [Candidatus Aenigmarchaeota archaeon]|nr:type II toxin-antitoxin system Phd/YefM family antitoxin [Candidatus Aenigmarchaeota archaeon]